MFVYVHSEGRVTVRDIYKGGGGQTGGRHKQSKVEGGGGHTLDGTYTSKYFYM